MSPPLNAPTPLPAAMVKELPAPDVTGMADNEFDSGVTSVGELLRTTLVVPVEVVTPVPPFATGNVPLTPVAKGIAERVPPRVNDPYEVTVPVSVSPLTVPAPETLVTVPVLTPRFVLAPAAVVAPVPPWAMSVTRSATGPMKTSFVPDVKLTALPELLDDKTVVRVSTDAEE